MAKISYYFVKMVLYVDNHKQTKRLLEWNYCIEDEVYNFDTNHFWIESSCDLEDKDRLIELMKACPEFWEKRNRLMETLGEYLAAYDYDESIPF